MANWVRLKNGAGKTTSWYAPCVGHVRQTRHGTWTAKVGRVKLGVFPNRQAAMDEAEREARWSEVLR